MVVASLHVFVDSFVIFIFRLIPHLVLVFDIIALLTILRKFIDVIILIPITLCYTIVISSNYSFHEVAVVQTGAL